MHPDISVAKKLVFDLFKLECSAPIIEAESAEYAACTFTLNNQTIRFRTAKTTPTKTGQFVTIWKRLAKGPIQPFDSSDEIEFVIISTRTEHHFGHFIFPKKVLCEHNVFSTDGKGGKRGIRVYPSWEKTLNKQAEKTQKWQVEYFLEIPDHQPIDIARARKLYADILHPSQ